MNESNTQKNESIALRILWMLLFVIVWQVAEVVLAGVVIVQLGYRLIYGAPSGSLMNFGDSLSQFLAQIGRFGTFHSDQKPWPFADWPTPRAPEGEAAHFVAPAPHPVRDEEPKL
ncbi:MULTISPECIES: DUF4389 domain-containing protein [Pseudomonas syringae group]|uniref:DUF4389 domain-containing protein n=4 Tax=Pseudomonas syringae group TaxID=136849 RepID=A0ABU7N864_PSEVI|nr:MULTISPECIES: DUF4389 domain-containing protein [Pseudomonas syringae group]MCF9019178.1 DUF4389 domain-containing protein [Pseudomonas syringae]KPY32650.1 Uncharacterized protein ALO52_03895 [Pseudomonas syringae pv. primulae]MBD8187931.1 DUF4389 domain-containing protein [Pseudomonas viridiflava]MBD8200404.1 DUF4389 domain-containing protein [Pseudomonas viridiflava]MBI6680645.1 DUF4389 domain-containing protein [Pseudomonas viridiflava]